CIADYKNDKLVCGNSEIRIRTKQPESAQIICTSNTIIIETNSRLIYKTKTKITDGKILIEKYGRFNVVETIADSTEQVAICLKNLTPIMQIIRAHTSICKITSCTVTKSVENQQQIINFIKEGVETEFVGNINE
ncbi:unnamed protein product, partial [Brachionus calyciflorus]